MAVELDPSGGLVEVGRVKLRTPGLQGSAERHLPGSDGLRSAEDASSAFDEALRNESVERQETIVLSGTHEVNVGGGQTRSTHYDEPAIEAQVPTPGDDYGQVLLYVDEADVATWNFARDSNRAIDTTRGGATRTYLVRRYVPPPATATGQRGLVGAIGKKLLKVLVFPLVDPVIGKVGDYFAHRWEQHKRPYRMRSFTPDDYNTEAATEITAERWKELGSGRALLMIHGTLSRAHTAFGRLPQEFVTDLHRHYDGRVFAFDHYTLSEDPRQNVEWFLQQIPDGTTLDVDVVCHSRGGLVSRILTEKQSELSLGSRALAVGKLVFVATPNAGTILTDAKYLGDLIDRYTNILNFFPDNGVTEILEGVITIVKHLAVGTLKGLEGLQSMTPGGTFLTGLNVTGHQNANYYAISSNYEPTSRGLAAFLSDRAADGYFQHHHNDLVVPTEGVFDANGAGSFPIADPYVLQAEAGVAHTQFFATQQARDKVLSWLNS